MNQAQNDNPEIARTIKAGGIATNYHDRGEGQPVMLIHGSGPGVTAWANWRLCIPALAKRYRVIAPDMVGFGYTDRRDVAGRQTRVRQHFATCGQCGVPEIAWHMLDPSGRREMLGELLLRHAGDLHLSIKQNGAGRCGALVNGEDMGHRVPNKLSELWDVSANNGKRYQQRKGAKTA